MQALPDARDTCASLGSGLCPLGGWPAPPSAAMLWSGWSPRHIPCPPARPRRCSGVAGLEKAPCLHRGCPGHRPTATAGVLASASVSPASGLLPCRHGQDGAALGVPLRPQLGLQCICLLVASLGHRARAAFGTELEASWPQVLHSWRTPVRPGGERAPPRDPPGSLRHLPDLPRPH